MSKPILTPPKLVFPSESVDLTEITMPLPNDNNTNQGSLTNLADLNTPDIIKNLPNFNGDPRDLQTFVDRVDRIEAILVRSSTDQVTISSWLQAIRQKIKGKASDRLRLHGEPQNWPDMRKCLQRHFSDHRDQRTLYSSLNNLRQTTSVNDFYEQILELVKHNHTGSSRNKTITNRSKLS